MGQEEMTPLICWDSSVLIDWIRSDETVSADIRQRIESVVDYVERNSCKLVFSTLVYAEVIKGKKMSGQSVRRFQDLMRNKERIELVAVTINVAEKAGKIRSESERKISTPDAIHIATAIISGATMFHTFDDGLLRLNGKEEVNGLSITACEIA